MRKTLYTATLVIGALLGASALSTLAAGTWNPAPPSPPAGNVDAPINVGTGLQEKLGSLLIDNNVGILGNLIIATGTGVGTKGKVLTAVDDSGTVTWTSTSSLGIVGGGSGGGGTSTSTSVWTLIQPARVSFAGAAGNACSSPSAWITADVSSLVPLGTESILSFFDAPEFPSYWHGVRAEARKDSSSPTIVLGNWCDLAGDGCQYLPSGAGTHISGHQTIPITSSRTFEYRVQCGNGDEYLDVLGYKGGNGNSYYATGAEQLLPDCAEGQTLKYTSGTWVCSSSAGVSNITAGTNISISSTGAGGTGNVTINSNAAGGGAGMSGVKRACGGSGCVAAGSGYVFLSNGTTYRSNIQLTGVTALSNVACGSSGCVVAGNGYVLMSNGTTYVSNIQLTGVTPQSSVSCGSSGCAVAGGGYVLISNGTTYRSNIQLTGATSGSSTACDVSGCIVTGSGYMLISNGTTYQSNIQLTGVTAQASDSCGSVGCVALGSGYLLASKGTSSQSNIQLTGVTP